MSSYDTTAVTSYPSPATAYEVALAELSSRPHDEKIVKVFEILDEVVPKLGVYSKIMNLVRQQLFDSVFSDQFTGSVNNQQHNKGAEKKISIERLTYYALYSKIKKDRDDRSENLQQKVNEIEKELSEKSEQIKTSKSKIESLETEIKNLNAEVKKLNEEIGEKKVEIFRAEKKLRVSTEEYNNQIEDLRSNIDVLKNNLKHSEEEVTDLSIYKSAYNEVHTSFAPSIADEFTRPRRKPIQLTRKNQLLTDITNSNKLEEQILTLINIATEEYDKHVEEYNRKLSKIRSNSPMNTKRSGTERNSSSQLNDAEFNILNQEMAIEKTNFKKSIMDLKNEHDLIAQHKKSLEEKLYLIEMDRETLEFIKRQRGTLSDTSSKNNSREKGLLTGLEEHYEPERKGPDRDQFISQERVLSKWSCMMYTSTNGTNWKEVKENKYCENCGDKTLVCPHKVTPAETIFTLPVNTTLIKFVRPKIHYNQAVVKQAVEVFKKSDYNIPGVDLQAGDHGVVLTNYPANYTTDYDEDNETLKILNEGNPDAGFLRTFQILWDDFNQRNIFEKRVARPFTYERTISLFVQFLAYLHDKESFTMGVTLSIVDNLYQFFEKRYDLDDVKYSAVYDFYASLYSLAPKSKIIEVFCHVLVGNLDRCVLNYILYMAEIIDKIDWKETEDVKPLFAIIYPFCDDDELDALTLDYTSFTENRINKKLVLEFIMSLILQRKEYLINEMQFKLSTQPTQSYYMMTEIEFTKTMEEFFYIYDEKQTKVYFETSLKYSMAFDGYTFCVPIDKLCYIASYYYLIQIAQELKRDIDDIIKDARDRRLREQVGTLDKSRQLIPWKDEFIKITDVDNLASAIAMASGPRDEDDFEMSMVNNGKPQPSMW